MAAPQAAPAPTKANPALASALAGALGKANSQSLSLLSVRCKRWEFKMYTRTVAEELLTPRTSHQAS
jgi:hypothetical protein